jgi:hypothetical protein
MNFSKFIKLLLLSVCCSFFYGISYAATVDTQLSKDKVSLGDTLTLSFTINGRPTQISPNFSALEKDFQILDTNYGNIVNMINGVTTTQSFWRLTIVPKKAGVIIIPEMNFGDDKSVSRKLIVAEAADHSISDKPNSPVFIEAEVSTTTPYIQSQVLYTFKLFYQSQLENPQVEIPQVKDATLVQLGEGNQYQTNVNGKTYMVVEKNFAIFPQKVGNISIPPTHLRALAYEVNASMSSDPFYMPDLQTLSLATKAFTLAVQKIPDQFQGTTWLPAKNISLTETWSVKPEQWELGNPVTRTITVTAEGLRADQIPDLTIDKMTGINIYVNPPKRSNEVKDNMVTGTLEQQVTYIPNSSQSFTLPAVKLNWWNAQTNTNAVTQLNSVSIQVLGKVNNTLIPPSNTTTVPAATITTSNQSAERAITTNNKPGLFYLSIWFWIAVLLFISWLMTLLFFWQKHASKNDSVSSEPVKPTTTPLETSEESFAQACKQGNATLAQQFLLSWAKKQWHVTPLNLEKLRDSNSDENFNSALQNLEQAIYAKNAAPWQGHDLLTAFQKVKKQRKQHYQSPMKTNNVKPDPLPPLNP